MQWKVTPLHRNTTAERRGALLSTNSGVKADHGRIQTIPLPAAAAAANGGKVGSAEISLRV